MPIVFVHGVPDTAAEWDPLAAALEARGVAETDLLRLALPGFGTPVPDGFACTKDEYAAWIVEQLEAIGSPVDLVGHDWGALFVEYVGSSRPELVRSWAAFDAALAADFVWHDLAQMWQTPEVGEQIMEAMVGDALVAGLRDGGHPDAEGAARFVDDRMKAAILALYRSAIDVGPEWHPTVAGNTRPAMLGWGELDPYATAERAQTVAEQAHAEFFLIAGAGHWAPIERPDECAAALTRFWGSLN
jgi:pimeloyl-ACP methyl ester carboxylesterase